MFYIVWEQADSTVVKCTHIMFIPLNSHTTGLAVAMYKSLEPPVGVVLGSYTTTKHFHRASFADKTHMIKS